MGGRLFTQDTSYIHTYDVITLADIFVGFHEQVWLSNCPSKFKPYRMYIDDTFLLFRSPSHLQLFLTFLNNQNQSIEFTCE